MNTELFEGTPDKLKIRLDAIIGGGGAIVQVIKATGGTWLIIWS